MSMFCPDQYRQQKLADFHGQIPDRVWPTPVWQLHQGGDILIYRNTDVVRGIAGGQHRMFHRHVALTDHIDAPGTVTVVVCTGLPGVTYDRQIAVYDHMHNDEKLRLEREPGEVGRFIGDWWKAREGVR